MLDKRDIALYKRKTGKPNTLVIMSGEIFEELLGEKNGNTTPKDTT